MRLPGYALSDFDLPLLIQNVKISMFKDWFKLKGDLSGSRVQGGGCSVEQRVLFEVLRRVIRNCSIIGGMSPLSSSILIR